MKKKGLEPL